MTQDEFWNLRYHEVMDFIESNYINPLKYAPEEKFMVHFLKRGRKLMNANAGEMEVERMERFRKLMEKVEEKKRLNRWKW